MNIGLIVVVKISRDALLDINTTIFEIEKLDIGCLVVILRGCFGRI
jgi:hypothetical protein